MTAYNTITTAIKAVLLMALVFVSCFVQALPTANSTVPPQASTAISVSHFSMIAIMLCLGFLIACALYCTYVALNSRERSYVYYVFCALNLIWMWCELAGLSSAVFNVPFLGGYLFLTFNTLFCARFLYLKRHSPSLIKWFKIGAALPILAIPCTWLLPESQNLILLLILCVLCIATIIGGVQSFKGGLKTSVYCVTANILLTASLFWAWQMPMKEDNQLADAQVIALVAGCLSYLILMAFALVGKFIAIARRNIESSENLEHKVMERTEQLQSANAHLEELADGLRNADAAKSTFLVNMSHEMRTPLTAIIGYADAIAQGDIAQSDEKHKAMVVIRNNGEHLLNIITDLLDISKIEANTLEVENKPFDLLGIVHQISQMVAAEVERKQLKFTVLYRLPLPTELISDAKRVRQILLNIINNAIKFTHQGEVEVLVKVIDDRLVCSIADTGIGMNQDQLDLIFQAFAQEDLTKSRQYGGAGLGLNIAKSLANKLGATIDVTSTQGQGSTFTVGFPLNLPESAHYLERQAQLDEWLCRLEDEQSLVQKVDMPTLNGKVLLAEDHPDNQRLFVRMLEGLGLNVTAVDNGYKAVQSTLENDFDLILMDIQMPEMDGLKAFELISGTCSDVPVVALTANAMKADVDLYMGMGFKDHIAKPVDRKLFVDTIAKYIGLSDDTEISIEGDELDEIKQQYVTRLVDRVADIKQAHTTGDWDEIGRHAHAIKGSAGMFGFDDLTSAGAALELAVREGEQQQCQTQLQTLLQLCEQITTNQV